MDLGIHLAVLLAFYFHTLFLASGEEVLSDCLSAIVSIVKTVKKLLIID